MAGSEESDHYYRGCLKTMLGEPQEEGLFNQTQIKEYIGASFREKVRHLVPGRVQFQSVSFFSYYFVNNLNLTEVTLDCIPSSQRCENTKKYDVLFHINECFIIFCADSAFLSQVA